MFGYAIGDRARLGRRALVALVWLLLLIALALASLANFSPGRAGPIGAARAATVDADSGPNRREIARPDVRPTRAPAQPALSNQNVSGR